MKRHWTITFIILILLHSSIFANDISFHHNTLSAADQHLKEVDISYDHDFPYKDDYDNQKIAKCTKAYRTVNTNYTKGSKHVTVKKTIPVLRCREHIRLLRPIKIINQWRHIQSKKYFFPLTIREFSIINRPAHIMAVRSINQINSQIFLPSKKTERVIGIFERHTTNIKTYTFKNTITGGKITVNATPEHLVYVKNKVSFIPMGSLSSPDELLNNMGEQIKLICPASHTEHCGVSLHNVAPILVYNLEVHKNHTYFISKTRLLVHNNCELTEKLKDKIGHLIKTKSESGRSFIYLDSYDDIQCAYSTLKTLRGDNIQSDTLAVLSVYQHQHICLPIDSLKFFLATRQRALSTKLYDEALRVLLNSTGMTDVSNERDLNAMLAKANNRLIVTRTDKERFILMHPRKSPAPTMQVFNTDGMQTLFLLNCKDRRLGLINGLQNRKDFGRIIQYFEVPELRWSRSI